MAGKSGNFTTMHSSCLFKIDNMADNVREETWVGNSLAILAQTLPENGEFSAQFFSQFNRLFRGKLPCVALLKSSQNLQ